MSDTPDRKQLILQATLELVAEHGLIGTTMALIAKRANSSPGIIYHYFASKEEIVHTLYEQVKKGYGQALLTGRPLELPWQERLKQVWLNSYHHWVAHPSETVFWEQYKNSNFAEHGQNLESDPSFAPLLQVLSQDITAGYIKPYPFEVLYLMTLGTSLALAKLTIAGQLNLDEATLESLAAASCQTVYR